MDNETLDGLRRLSGVTAAYIVDQRGVVDGGSEDEVAQVQGELLAAVVGALRQATDSLACGELTETIVEAEKGAIIAGSLGAGRAAVVLARDRSSLGMIRVELRRLRRGT